MPSEYKSQIQLDTEYWDSERRELRSRIQTNTEALAAESMENILPLPMLGDAAENEWTSGEERPIDDHPEPYLCPDILWQGVFEQVADVVQKRSWEVWMGTACALGAIAHRNIHVRYHANLYGWFYGLLVSPTGTGKSVCTDVCKALLPDDYHQDSNVQSGPGLAPILADIERDAKGKVLSVNSQPAIIVLSEWTAILKNLKIQNATLGEDLNALFDGQSLWTISRSEANRQGGGRVEIPSPSLSICATTTGSMFHGEVTAKMILSGFLNRYLVIPGSHKRWKLEDPTSGVDYDPLREILPRGQPFAFGLGMDVWKMYDQDAHDYFILWGKPLFEDSLMNLNGNGTPNDDVFKRLHTYAHKIAMLYAWSERSPLIHLSHAKAAKVVVETSLRFIRQLVGDIQPDQPPHLSAKATLDALLTQAVKARVGISKAAVCNRFWRHGGYSAVSQAVESLVKAGALRVELGGDNKKIKKLFVSENA